MTPPPRVLDAAVGIGEVVLGAIRRAAVGAALRLAALHHAGGWTRSVVILRRRLLGFGLQRRFGGTDALEPCRLVGDPIRHLVAALLGTMLTIFRRIGGLGVGKPSRDLGGKLLFGFPHAPIGHRLVHAGIGLHLGAVERHMPEPDQPCRPAQLEHLHEQVAQRLQMPPPKPGDRTVIGAFIAVTAMKSTRSSQACAILREEYTPRL